MNPLLYSLLKNYQQEQLLLNSFRNENSTLFPLFTPPNQSPPSPELSLLAFLGSPIFGNHLLPLCSLPDFNKNLIETSISNNFVDSISNSSSINESETNSESTSSSSSEARTKENEREYFKEYKIGTKVVRRLSYPREFKLIVLHSYWTNGKNKYRTCKEFHITKSMLNGWLQKAEKIRNSRPGSLKSGRSGRKPQFPKIENQLFQLFQAEENKGENVSNKWIRETARILAEKEENNCQFSERWLNNFKRRFQIGITIKDENEQFEESQINSIKDDWSIENDQKMNKINNESNNLKDEELDRIAHEICSINGQLPIKVFYEKFHRIGQNVQLI
uniref:HTH CENPB-type domain-containing protein n=1 Tax=Meloidogyne enterolobii TaxID=390850 RepID=A0A6V7XLX5_MELEN|nr:unnamed protein product [Meloidogyne enterolobii]